MTERTGKRVLGVDACRKGWIGITDDARGYFGADIAALVSAAARDGDLAVVAVDIPIGLPVSSPRAADRLARRVVGRRASSVFSTPVRAALTAATHAEATALSVRATGQGLSQQAYALRRKILDVDGWLALAPCAVIEVHPEVCFATMAGRALRHPKSTWAGSEERRALLREAGVVVPSGLGVAGELASPDDVLDAAAAAWSARRHADGVSTSYPSPPEQVGEGREAAIWV